MDRKNLLIGAHTSAAGGCANALYHAQKIGATITQLFTSNQKQWKGKVFTQEDLEKWEKALKETDITTLTSHASYLINLGSPNQDLLKRSCAAFSEEISRCHTLGISFLVFHPGAATGSEEEQCLDTIVKSLLSLAPITAKGNTRLLLETTAGQGTTVGYRFEHLHYIIERVSSHVPIGVCMDTCHIFSAGYDIRTEKSCIDTLDHFDEVVGLDNLYAFHLNDSLKELGSRKDRHANIGKGEIGPTCFDFLITYEKTKNLPFYLETPNGETHWKDEIAHFKHLAGARSSLEN